MNNLAQKLETSATIKINVNQLRAGLSFCAVAMSKEESRHYLRGVFFDKRINEPLQLVATDGHRLHKYTIELPEGWNHAEFNFIMPKNDVATWIKALAGLSKINFEALMEFNEAGYTITLPNAVLSGVGIDGKFPDYSRVIPNISEENPAIWSGFMAHYISDTMTAFSKIGKELGYRAVAVKAYQTGKELEYCPVVFKAPEGSLSNALAVIMPVRV